MILMIERGIYRLTDCLYRRIVIEVSEILRKTWNTH